MTRKLRVLSLALVAVFAMSALAASVASAKYDSEVKATGLTGSNVFFNGTKNETSHHLLTLNATNVTCNVSSFSGTNVGEKEVVGGWTSKTLTVHPTYSGCEASSIPTNVSTTGCNYKFLEPNAELKASTEVVCEPGKNIVITIVGLCVINIGSQATTGHVRYVNTGTGSTRDVDVIATITGITYSSTICGNGSNGTYNGTTTVKGYSDAEHTKQVGIWVTN